MITSSTVLRRRDLLSGGSLAVATVLGMPAAPAQAPETKPRLPLEMVQQFVSKSHASLDDVRELAKQEPMLVRASWDWSAGDWETGLGAASHMGRRDIAKYLIDSGARIDVFAVFMLGELAPAKALLAAFPDIHKTPGPHGIPLLSHAIVGRKESFDAFRLLIDAGADVNAAAWRGATPLLQAIAAEQPDTVRILLDRGAAVSQQALELAHKKNLTAIVGMLETR